MIFTILVSLVTNTVKKEKKNEQKQQKAKSLNKLKMNQRKPKLSKIMEKDFIQKQKGGNVLI